MKTRMQYRLKILKALYVHLYGVKSFFILYFLASIITVALNFATPVVYKSFIDKVILGADLELLAYVLIAYLIIHFLDTAVTYICVCSKRYLVNTVLLSVRKQILNNFFAYDYQDYEKTSIGDMKMRIEDDTKQIEEFIGKQSVEYAIAFIIMIVCTIILFYINWLVACFAVITIPLTFGMDNLISKHEKKVLAIRRENQQRQSSWLHASIQAWKEVKALNLSKRETRTFYEYLHVDMKNFTTWINYWTARVLVIPKLKNEFFMQFGLYLIGGLLILYNKLEISNLLVVSIYYNMLSDAVKIVSGTDADLQAGMAHTDRLFESLTNVSDKRCPKMIPMEGNKIEMKNVTYIYPGTDTKIFDAFNLVIGQGERVAIVGKSGVGKTTLLKLMTGLLKPTKGTVSIAGVDLQKIDLEALHRKIGFVMQENMLFHTTIYKTLLYGKEDATEEEMIEACKKACIYEFIEQLPDGMHTVIGEKGVKLSGGQRQRIVLARLFLRDVEIFIFDEATSALDQYSENLIQDVIEHVGRNKTIVVVAHRESSLRVCERIVRL